MYVENGKYIEKIYGLLKKENQNSMVIDHNLTLRKDIYDLFLNKKFERKIDDILLFVGSWNYAGKEVKESALFLDWLLPVKDTNTPDIYIIGLQEIVDL